MTGRVIGGRLYGVCDDCGKIIRMDKPIFGSVHICTLPEERKEFAQEIRDRREAAEKWLKEVQS